MSGDEAVIGPAHVVAVVTPAEASGATAPFFPTIPHQVTAHRGANAPVRDPGWGRVEGTVVKAAAAEPLRQEPLVHRRVFFTPGKREVGEKALNVPC
jgi:hypothetical protein